VARHFANRSARSAALQPSANWARHKSSPDIARAIQRTARGMTSPDDLLALQQTLGNQAVGSLLAGHGKQPPAPRREAGQRPVQRSLGGMLGDAFEFAKGFAPSNGLGAAATKGGGGGGGGLETKGGGGSPGMGGSETKGGGASTGFGGGGSGFHSADTKAGPDGSGGAGAGKGGDFAHEDMPWGGMWKTYQQAKTLTDYMENPPTPVSDDQSFEEEEWAHAY
jgi:hypothetical protein